MTLNRGLESNHIGRKRKKSIIGCRYVISCILQRRLSLYSLTLASLYSVIRILRTYFSVHCLMSHVQSLQVSASRLHCWALPVKREIHSSLLLPWLLFTDVGSSSRSNRQLIIIYLKQSSSKDIYKALF